MNFRTDVDVETGVLIVRIPKRFLITMRQEFEERIRNELDDGRRQFALDFSSTHYVDGAPYGTIVNMNKVIQEEGGEMILMNLSKEISDYLYLTRLCTVLAVVTANGSRMTTKRGR